MSKSTINLLEDKLKDHKNLYRIKNCGLFYFREVRGNFYNLVIFLVHPSIPSNKILKVDKLKKNLFGQFAKHCYNHILTGADVHIV